MKTLNVLRKSFLVLIIGIITFLAIERIVGPVLEVYLGAGVAVVILSIVAIVIKWPGEILYYAKKVSLLLPSFDRSDIYGSKVFAEVFNFKDEKLYIFYTCRSRIDHAPCPQYQQGSNRALAHVSYIHTAADELHTFISILDQYYDRVCLNDREQSVKNLSCTYPFDEFVQRDNRDSNYLLTQAPEFLYENLIVVGENSLSELMLDRLRPVLNFYPYFHKDAPWSPQGRTLARAVIDLIPLADTTNLISEVERNSLRTHFDDRDGSGGNAVAMICFAPNPFSIRKKIIILYGCHRVGQYLLDEWLSSPGAVRTLTKISKYISQADAPFGQIVLHGNFRVAEIPDNYQFSTVNSVKNRNLKLDFFPIRTKTKNLSSLEISEDQGAIHQKPMVDISLVLDLGRHINQSTINSIDSFFTSNKEFLRDQYWESKAEGIGLHVTLFEFATYIDEVSLEVARNAFQELQTELDKKIALLRQPKISFVGFEVLSSAIILYVELPSAFIEVIERICKDVLPGTKFFNKRHTPFPLHCTVLRFTNIRSWNEDQKAELLSFASSFHTHKFTNFQTKVLSITLANKQPFQKITARHDIELSSWKRHMSTSDLPHDLQYACLDNVSLGKEYFHGANLRDASLQRAELCGIDLEGANLMYANLAKADLTSANLLNAQIQLAKFDEDTLLPDGSNWTARTDVLRFSDPNHPDFWQR